MNVQESQRTPDRLDKRKSPQHIMIKMQNIQNEERILRAAKDNGQVQYKGRPTE